MLTKSAIAVALLLSVSVAARPLERPGEGGITNVADLPGWWHAGTNPTAYEVAIDRDVHHVGKASARIRSLEPAPTGYGTLMQIVKADRYRGKAIRMTAWLKADNVARQAMLWIRVDGRGPDPKTGKPSYREITGTSDWQQIEVVVDVPADAGDIAFGASLTGAGTLWVDEIRFEKIPFDKVRFAKDAQVPPPLPLSPQNLDIEGGGPPSQ